MTKVRVSLPDHPSFHATAKRKGWPIDTFTGTLVQRDFPYRFWSCVLPDGELDHPSSYWKLPPMYTIDVIGGGS